MKDQNACPGALPPAAHAGHNPSTFGDGMPALAFDMLEQSLGKETALEVSQAFVCFVAEVTAELEPCIRKRNIKTARLILRELSSSCTVMGAAALLQRSLVLDAELLKGDWQSAEVCLHDLLLESKSLGSTVSMLFS